MHQTLMSKLSEFLQSEHAHVSRTQSKTENMVASPPALPEVVAIVTRTPWVSQPIFELHRNGIV